MKATKSSGKNTRRQTSTTKTVSSSKQSVSSVNGSNTLRAISSISPSRFINVSSPSEVSTDRAYIANSSRPSGSRPMASRARLTHSMAYNDNVLPTFSTRLNSGMSDLPTVKRTTSAVEAPSRPMVSMTRPTATFRPKAVSETRIKPVTTRPMAQYSTSVKPTLTLKGLDVPHTPLKTKHIYNNNTTLASILPAHLAGSPLFDPSRGIKVNADRLRKGNIIEFGDDKKKVRVESVKAAMMGRRPTSLQMELRDPQSGKTYPARFMPGDSVELIELDPQTLNFLYCEGEVGYVMHPETFEQFEFESSIFGPARDWIPADTSIQCFFYNGAIFSLNLPDTVVAKVQSIPLNPVITMHSGNEFQEVTCTNGQKIKVPVFIQEGEEIRVKLEDISFMSRA